MWLVTYIILYLFLLFFSSLYFFPPSHLIRWFFSVHLLFCLFLCSCCLNWSDPNQNFFVVVLFFETTRKEKCLTIDNLMSLIFIFYFLSLSLFCFQTSVCLCLILFTFVLYNIFCHKSISISFRCRRCRRFAYFEKKIC
jgi:hypothetical protein